jgi:phage terminase large subunit
MPSLTEEKRIERFADPALFQQDVLNRDLWKVQRNIAAAIDRRSRVSVKGCHASGKTFVSSGLPLWWLAKHKRSLVITTAPTLRQVKLMWGEVEVARAGCKIAFPQCTTTGLQIAKDRYGIGFSSSHGINAQGFHSENILLIADEAPGISGEVWDAIEGILAGGNVRLLKLGNPTVPSGPFFDDFHRGRSSTECITISAFDTPNLAGVTLERLLEMNDHELDVVANPYLVTRRWVREKYERWGPNNPRYVSRVLGEFPSQSDHAVFDLAWIERAKRPPTDAELERAKGCFVQVGIDVAGPGDDETAAVARVNGIIIKRESWADPDPRGKVLNWLGNLKVSSGYPLGPVVVDVVGIGYNFALHLADQGFQVMGFSAGKKPMDTVQFKNAKAEGFWRLRDMYKSDYISHIEGTVDEETEAQLSGIEYRETSLSLIQIEPKEEARKRGVQSPDRAEAEMMAFCRVQPQTMTVQYGMPVDTTIA